MTNDQIYSESVNPLQTFPGRHAVTEQFQTRALKQLGSRSETPAAVTV